MFSILPTLVSACWFLNMFLLVNAGLYVLKPTANATCHAGHNCTIEWIDDGSAPLLSAMALCKFGLYHGNQKLVQTIPAVDVSSTQSVTFVPNAAAGPNSDTYYISVISISHKDNNNTPSAAFSPFFNIDQMTGSFATPLPEATSTQPIPSGLPHSGNHSTIPLSTITIGTLSTSLPPISTPTAPVSTLVSSTRIATSIIPSILTHTTATGTTTGSTPSASSTIRPLNGALGLRPVPALFIFFLSPMLSVLS